jgi:hypothetical protein
VTTQLQIVIIIIIIIIIDIRGVVRGGVDGVSCKSSESVEGREYLASLTNVILKKNYNLRYSVNAVHFICCFTAVRTSVNQN